MLSQEIVKMEITSHYHFNNDFFHATFVIDFENEKAYWDPKYFEHLKFMQDFYEKEGLGKYKAERHKLFELLTDRVTHDEYTLHDIGGFFHEIDEKDVFGQFEHLEPCGSLLGHVDFLNVFYISLYSFDSKEYYVVKWGFPEFWFDFGQLLENLVGFDVLNISNSKYFISNLNYDVLNDWIVDRNTGEGLILDKIGFNYYTHRIGDWTRWSIDFSNRTLVLQHKFNEKLTESLSGDVINHVINLLKYHHVFSWSLKESWSDLPGGCWSIHDGYSWCLEFEFNNGSVYNIGGDNVILNGYLKFANDIKELFNFDLLRCGDCKNPGV